MEDLFQTSLKGAFLIAMPALADPNFHQTVTCLCEHTQEGAVGLVINRPHDVLTTSDIFKELKMEFTPEHEHKPVYIGGPVHEGEVFVLHGPPFDWMGCLQVTPSLALTTTRDILEAIAKGVGPERALIVLGCAGWDAGQLEMEIKENVWLTSAIDETIIFKETEADRWRKAMERLGIDPRLLSDNAGHA
jgi:putative transcriptional regulator